MGLDQILIARKEDEEKKIGSWRKHANLQGYMQDLAVSKGIVKRVDDFNCVDLELETEDIETLLGVIESDDLKETHGIFFGSSYGNQAERDEDRSFFADAVLHRKDGWRIVYSCWW